MSGLWRVRPSARRHHLGSPRHPPRAAASVSGSPGESASGAAPSTSFCRCCGDGDRRIGRSGSIRRANDAAGAYRCLGPPAIECQSNTGAVLRAVSPRTSAPIRPASRSGDRDVRPGLWLITGFAALASASVVAGCGGGSASGAAGTTTGAPGTTATAPTATSAPPKRQVSGACVSVPAALDRAILTSVVLADARFVKMQAVRASATPSFYYVSGSVNGSGTRRLLATWVTSDLKGGKPIYSVDANAALISVFGASSQASPSLSIDAPGAYRSRTCVAGHGAALGSPAPGGGRPGAPAGQ